MANISKLVNLSILCCFDHYEDDDCVEWIYAPGLQEGKDKIIFWSSQSMWTDNLRAGKLPFVWNTYVSNVIWQEFRFDNSTTVDYWYAKVIHKITDEDPACIKEIAVDGSIVYEFRVYR